MTDTLDHRSLPEDELLAAEYALGVLAGADRAAAEQRIARERTFARLVAEWEQRLAPWTAEIVEVAPPPQVWDRIAAALPRASTGWRIVAQPHFLARVQLCGGRARCGLPHGTDLSRAQLRNNSLSSPASKVAATAISSQPSMPDAEPSRSCRRPLVPTQRAFPSCGSSRPDGKPRPVGLLRADQTVTLTLPAEFAAFAKGDAVLAVSLEPPGGSTTGLPTGPVIATGKLTSL